MIRVARRPAPPSFDELVAGPGKKWLADNPPPRRPPSYWLKVQNDVIEAFEGRCAYTAMWLSHDGEIDHFVSIDEDRAQAYSWSNYRYATSWINRCKRHLRSSDMVDPFEIEDDWFEILLPSLQLVVTDRCPAPLRPTAELMLKRLRLGDGPQVMRSRQAFYAMYQAEQPATLALLDRFAPLIARAIRKAAAR